MSSKPVFCKVKPISPHDLGREIESEQEEEPQDKILKIIRKANSPIIKRQSQTKYRRYKKVVSVSPAKSQAK